MPCLPALNPHALTRPPAPPPHALTLTPPPLPAPPHAPAPLPPQLPARLKKQLLLDYEAIMEEDRLLPLPRNPSASGVLQRYVNEVSGQAVGGGGGTEGRQAGRGGRHRG